MSQLAYTGFQEILFPPQKGSGSGDGSENLSLRSTRRFRMGLSQDIRRVPMVVFDFETTGLNAAADRIIEIGAVRLENFEFKDQFQALVNPQMPLSPEVEKLTGITNDMLAGAPLLPDVLPGFLEFIGGGFLVAHNAEFDMAFLSKNCLDHGIILDWDCFCSLKAARQMLPELESKGLDSLARHYELSFEARHRSIGDCKVTAAVLERMLQEQETSFYRWSQLQPFTVQSSQ